MSTGPHHINHVDRVAAAYDHWAEPYAELFADPAHGHPWDRAAMTVLAETVRAGEPGPVADLGCGPGHWTAYLADACLDVHGVDVSADLVALARAAHPGLRFEYRSMTDSRLPDRSLRGAVAWFSLIHVVPVELPAVLRELRRLLADDAPLLVGFPPPTSRPARPSRTTTGSRPPTAGPSPPWPSCWPRPGSSSRPGWYGGPRGRSAARRAPCWCGGRTSDAEQDDHRRPDRARASLRGDGLARAPGADR